MKNRFRKKHVTAGMAAILALAAPWSVYAKGEEEEIQFLQDTLMMASVGDTYHTLEILEVEGITGEESEEELLFSTFDESIAEVDEDGVITAVGEGITTIVVSLASDETVSASVDVVVYDYCGVYYGEKHIEAMGCDIIIEMTLNDDGTYSYYRAPMVIERKGGGEMPELVEEGIYEVNGTEFTFIGEELGEYTAVFQMDEELASLEGKLPTGGADTEMILEKQETEEETETEERTQDNSETKKTDETEEETK